MAFFQNEIKLIIFDLDDTLFDYKETEKLALFNTCDELGIDSIDDLYYYYRTANEIVHKGYKHITINNIYQFRNSRAKLFLSLINHNEINEDDFVNIFLKYSTNGVLIDRVEQTLQKLPGIIKVVATNGTNFPRQNKLESSRIAKYFQAYYSAENLGVSKPESKFFRKIMEHFNILNNEVLSVGDNFSNDILSAIDIGMNGCWFNYQNVKCNTVLPKNVVTITKFNELNIILGG